MGKPTPLLILSDAPTAGTGLGGIAKDLATRIAAHMPETFRVATAGYGGIVSRHLNFHQYILEGARDFVCPTLPEIWEDFAGNEKGVLLTIWDLSRLAWLAQPKIQCEIARLSDFLSEKPFKLWGYFPIDAEGPNRKLTYPLKQTLMGFDRVLAYGKWAANIVDRTLDFPAVATPYLPHGIDSSIFYERNRKMCRKMFISFTQACTIMGNLGERIDEDCAEILIGIVATNQARKDWQLGIKTVALLAKTHNVRLWIKTDVLERHWSIPALLLDYGINNQAIISLGDLSDDDMARAYSACDLTLGIGLGEGFGYPVFESIACQTSCIHGNYGGALEWMHPSSLVDPIAYRYEGVFACKRPVFSAKDWVNKAEQLLRIVPRSEVKLNNEIDWNLLWPRWEYWLKEGIK